MKVWYKRKDDVIVTFTEIESKKVLLRIDMKLSFGQALHKKATELALPQSNLEQGSITVYPLPILGCSEEEIQTLAELQGVTGFPYIFLEFLRYMGRASGDLYRGYDIGYQYFGAYNMKSKANKVLIRDGKQTIQDQQFVFMNLGGHSFWFFSTDEVMIQVFICIYWMMEKMTLIIHAKKVLLS
jgi:hypothetical protein